MEQLEAALQEISSSRPLDYLSLDRSKDISLILKLEELKNELKESVLFSQVVEKRNRRERLQSRVLLVTDKAIYNILPSDYSNYQRRIMVDEVTSITLSSDSDDFIIHVHDQYDYWLCSLARPEICRLIFSLYKKRTGEDLVVHVENYDDLNRWVTTKAHLRERTSIPPRYIDAMHVKFRTLVSKKKRRYTESGFNLDLTYIADNLLAMGLPSRGIEGCYRNPVSQVVQFLDSRHKDMYKVYNLAIEKRYEPAIFYNRVEEYLFHDHTPPPLEMILNFCQDISAYLEEVPFGIAAIHCKAGKGRTGLMIASYLIFSGKFATAEEALMYYAYRRTHNGKGVTIPSQIRYVHYFEDILKNYINQDKPYEWKGRPLVMSFITLKSIPHFGNDGGCSPHFVITDINKKELFDSRALHKVRRVKQTESEVSFQISARIAGDICITFFSEDKHMFHFWFNTNMIKDYSLCLQKSELDKALKDTEHKRFDEDFSLSVIFREDDIIRPEEYMAKPKDETESKRKLEVMSSQMKKTLKAYSKLYSKITGGSSPRPSDSLKQCLEENHIAIKDVSWDPAAQPPKQRSSDSEKASPEIVEPSSVPGPLPIDHESRLNLNHPSRQELSSLPSISEHEPSSAGFERTGENHPESYTDDSSDERIPDERVNEEHVPDERVSEEFVPEERVHDERAPEERVPEERVHDELIPHQRFQQRLSAGAIKFVPLQKEERADDKNKADPEQKLDVTRQLTGVKQSPSIKDRMRALRKSAGICDEL